MWGCCSPCHSRLTEWLSRPPAACPVLCKPPWTTVSHLAQAGYRRSPDGLMCLLLKFHPRRKMWSEVKQHHVAQPLLDSTMRLTVSMSLDCAAERAEKPCNTRRWIDKTAAGPVPAEPSHILAKDSSVARRGLHMAQHGPNDRKSSYSVP